ncbi:MAG: ATP-binding protein [Gaiellaceae bacterium]
MLPQGTVTLVFTDIEGSTRLSGALGERYADLLEAHRRVLRDAFAEHGGVEVDTQGDAFFVAFAGAHDAVAAAVDAQRGLAALDLRVRIGIHTGEPQLTAEGYYVGVDLSVGARVCAAAHGGQILLSPATHELVGADTAVLDLGEHLLKDVSGPLRLFQAVAPGLRQEFPPPRARPPGNLSKPAVDVHGRADDVRQIQELLRDHAPLVTLTGPGGVGKTTTAMKAAWGLQAEFRDGIYVVSFAAADTILGVVAEVLEVEERPNETLLEAIGERLSDRAILLVLDNLDALVASAGEVGRLLGRCPGLKVLATSRERLHLRVEREVRLAPLAETDAVALFVARAAAAGGDELEDEPALVQAICRRLDGLPLAIELAAARARALPLQTILERLERRLRFLTGGARDLPPRQRTLTATIDWSYELLPPHEQKALRALAVFVGGIPLPGAETVGPGLDVLLSLRDKSLLARSAAIGRSPRFSMLETIREYALERLVSAGEDAAARRRHAAYYLELAQQLQPDLSGPRQADALRRLGEEHENVRMALTWCDDIGDRELLVAFCAALWRFWLVRGHLTDGRAWLARALADEDESRPVVAQALFGACALNAAAGEFEDARQFATRRVDVARELHDDVDTASALSALANVNVHLGQRERAALLYEEAAGYARAADARPVLAAIVNNLGYLKLLADEPQAAVGSCSEAVALFAELGRPADAAGARLNVATAHLLLDELREAAAELGGALGEYVELEYDEGISYCLDAAAALALAQGDGRDAALLAAAAKTARDRSGVTPEPVEQRVHDTTVAAARSALDDRQFAEAWHAGASLPLGDAVRAARATALAEHSPT